MKNRILKLSALAFLGIIQGAEAKTICEATRNGEFEPAFVLAIEWGELTKDGGSITIQEAVVEFLGPEIQGKYPVAFKLRHFNTRCGWTKWGSADIPTVGSIEFSHKDISGCGFGGASTASVTLSPESAEKAKYELQCQGLPL